MSTVGNNANGQTSEQPSSKHPLAGKWLGFYQKLRLHRKTKRLGLPIARAMLADYRALEHDLNRAPNGSYRTSLQSIYLQTQEYLMLPDTRWRPALWHWLSVEVPTSFKALRLPIAIAVALFVLFGIAGFVMVTAAEEMAGIFIGQAQMDEVRAGKVWTDSVFTVAPAVVLSFGIMLNNIVVCLTTFVVGIVFGLGTIYMMAVNGLMLGGLLAFCHHYGVMYRLLHFIPAHGVVELFIICVSAGCGLYVGDALVSPGAKTFRDGERIAHVPSRAESFRDAIHVATPVMLFACLGLVVCGIIEGYVSPHPNVPMWTRLVIGFGWFVIFFSMLAGWIYRKPAAALSK